VDDVVTISLTVALIWNVIDNKTTEPCS